MLNTDSENEIIKQIESFKNGVKVGDDCISSDILKNIKKNWIW